MNQGGAKNFQGGAEKNFGALRAPFSSLLNGNMSALMILPPPEKSEDPPLSKGFEISSTQFFMYFWTIRALIPYEL